MASIFARALWSAVNNPLFTFTGLCDFNMPIPSPCIFMDLMCVSVTWPDISIVDHRYYMSRLTTVLEECCEVFIIFFTTDVASFR